MNEWEPDVEIQQIVLLEMKPGKRYDGYEISELTGLTVKQSCAALRQLMRGNVISGWKKGRRYEYETKQYQLPI